MEKIGLWLKLASDLHSGAGGTDPVAAIQKLLNDPHAVPVVADVNAIFAAYDIPLRLQVVHGALQHP